MNRIKRIKRVKKITGIIFSIGLEQPIGQNQETKRGVFAFVPMNQIISYQEKLKDIQKNM